MVGEQTVGLVGFVGSSAGLEQAVESLEEAVAVVTAVFVETVVVAEAETAAAVVERFVRWD